MTQKNIPDVSVVIINWNTKDLVIECIRSIREHTHTTKLEIIIVDNGSTDGTQLAIHKKFPGVKFIQNNENLGFAKANNIGMRIAVGKFICLVNSDVEIRGECIDRMYNYLEDMRDIGMLGPKTFYPNGEIQHTCKQFPSIWTSFCEAIGLHNYFKKCKFMSPEEMTFFGYDETHEVDVVSGSFMMVKRETIDRVGLFDENFFFYSEDVDWCRRIWKAGWKVVFYHEAEIIHHEGGSSKTDRAKYSIQLLNAKLQYWSKYYGSVTVLCVKCIKVLQLLRKVVQNFLSLIFLFRKKTLNRKNIFKTLRDNIKCIAWLIICS